jgi:multidrug efflux pump
MLTLYTTPVIYIYLDRFGLWLRAFRARGSDPAAHGSLVPGE